MQLLLSIRNYDLSTWNNKITFYDEILNNIRFFIFDNNLDGVDIEYPGMRGDICSESWGNNNEDMQFVNFIKNMKVRLQPMNKRIMLTVGSLAPNPLFSLNDDIDFLNIETYHYSLYNQPFPQAGSSRTYSNSPSFLFTDAYNRWSGNGISKEKIIMGVDFGNTVQIVTNSSITEYQSVPFYNVTYDFKSLPPEIFSQLIPIKGLCPGQNGQNSALYSWPWKGLSNFTLNATTNYCTTKSDWNRRYDSNTHNPWLTKVYNPGFNFAYYFVSYEDISSLRFKLNSVLPQVVGVSMSDVSYDDNNNSILSFIRGIPLPVDLPPNPNNNPNSGKGTSTSNPTDSTIADDKNHLDKQKTRVGVIVGAVLGGLLLLVVSSFIWYRQRSHLKSGAIPKSSMRSHTTSTKNVEMSSDSSPNRFAVPTTVIPVASGYVTAMFDFEGKEENDLSFKKGDKIEVLERGDGPNDWWVGRVNGTVGEFPGKFLFINY